MASCNGHGVLDGGDTVAYRVTATTRPQNPITRVIARTGSELSLGGLLVGLIATLSGIMLIGRKDKENS